jgi:hypothetical protein
VARRAIAAVVLGLGLITPARAAALPCRAFPFDNYWHADVRGLPVNARSAQWLSHMTPASDLHPDFGGPYGIPVTVVGRSHPRVPVRFQYADESDRVRYPLGADTRIEGGSDRHAVIVQRRTCKLFETYGTVRSGGTWTAGSGAVWSLSSNALRPLGWTSADAAGLPILPGLLRAGEVRRRRVDHAIRFTTDVTDDTFLWPARHAAGSVNDPSYPPMGARFRLRSAYRAPAGTSRGTRAVLTAMRRYGLVLADNGSPWYFQGATDKRWAPRLIAELKRVPASAFEAVDTAPLRIRASSMRVRLRP